MTSKHSVASLNPKLAVLTLLAVFLILNPNDSFAAKPVETEVNLKETPLKDFVLWSQIDISPVELLEMRRDLKNARREIGRDFGNAFPNYQFNVILTNPEVFSSYAKTPKHVAGLFDGRIHIPIPDKSIDTKALKSILWHEYTHAVVWFYSKGKCPLWLTEGFAVYQQEKIQPQSPPRFQTVLNERGELNFSLKELNSILSVNGRHGLEQVIMAYNEAYAMVDYLFTRYSNHSILKFIEAMGRMSYQEALKSVLHLTENEWEQKIKAHIARR